MAARAEGGGTAGRDGTELYYQSARDALHAVPIEVQGDVPEVGLPESLFTPPSGPEQLYDVANIAPELVATDGDRFLFHVLAGEAPVDAIRIVLDWRQLLTR